MDYTHEALESVSRLFIITNFQLLVRVGKPTRPAGGLFLTYLTGPSYPRYQVLSMYLELLPPRYPLPLKCKCKTP